jgi:hypothetical protein
MPPFLRRSPRLNKKNIRDKFFVKSTCQHDSAYVYSLNGIYDLKVYSCIIYWGLVIKCYESRTRQHKVLKVNIFRPSKHYFL